MTLTRTRFRHLFMLFLASSVAGAVIGEGGVSPTLKLAYEAEPNRWFDDHLWLMLGMFAAYLAVAIAGMIGMYRFRLWGRSVSLWSTLVGLVLYPFMGVDLSSPLATACKEIGEMSWGALLALAYFSPLAAEFRDAEPAARAIVSAVPSE